MRLRSTQRLDPVWRLGLPRPSALLRATLVAVLLTLAAAVLYTDPGAGGGVSDQPGASGTPAASASHGAGSPAPGRVAVPPGLVGVPIRLADPAPLAVVRRGDRVDLIVLPDNARPRPATLATGALVLDSVSGPDVPLPVLYLALTDVQARAVAAAGAAAQFGVIVRSQ